ncbi:MAG: DUF5610 domain-containing protein [Hydrogenophaga sp.]|nr:DUF5610 domain-containing protein [Hydrogenophaga sp.]
MVTPSIGFPRTVTPAASGPTGTAPPSMGRASEAQEAQAPNKPSSTSPSGLRSQQNAQILQASMDVSIQSGNASLTLLYRTAIDRINEFLAPEFGPNAIGSAEAPDSSPDATAARILSLSTAFYDAFAAQAKNKDKAPDALAREFVDLIRGGFERGFGEAKDILTGLNVLGADSPIEQGINQTYALVMKGYDDFLASKLAAQPATDTPPANRSKDTDTA